MRNLGYSRMVFIGEDGSMGYHQGKEYALRFDKSTLYERLILGYDFWITDLSGEGQPCPYSSVVTFLMNWESTK